MYLRIRNIVVDRRRAEELFVGVYIFVAVVLLFAGLIKYMAASLHWPLLFDTQEMLYINFLIQHGMAPYRDISDMNMPGTYMFHALAAAAFGPSDVGWRLCEFSLGFFLIGCMTLIARPYGRLAGPLAGVLFLLLHGTHGPGNAVQRDEIMTVFAIAGYAALFESLRRRRPWLSGLFGLFVGFAITIKPSIAPLAVVALGAAAYGARRQGSRVLPYMLYGLGGIAASVAAAVVYILYYHATHDFLLNFRSLLAYFAASSPTWAEMVSKLIQWPLKDFILLALAAELARLWFGRNRRVPEGPSSTWEMYALGGGVLVGLASYLIQHKGFSYHIYPFYAFLLLWTAILAARAIRAPGPARWLAVAAVSYAILRSMPLYLHQVEAFSSKDVYASYLEADLRQIGAARLNHQVQCMDVVLGCMTALYHDQIVQYSGVTGDLLFFVPVETPTVAYSRNLFLHRIQANPPAVFVVSNQRWGAPESFEKLNAWPSFKDYLEQGYVLTTQRQFMGDAEPPVSLLGSETGNMAYRIYIRKGSPLLEYAPRTPAR